MQNEGISHYSNKPICNHFNLFEHVDAYFTAIQPCFLDSSVRFEKSNMIITVFIQQRSNTAVDA